MPRTGLIFMIGILMICLMVAVGMGMLFLFYQERRAEQERHPVIGRPIEPQEEETPGE